MIIDTCRVVTMRVWICRQFSYVSYIWLSVESTTHIF